MSLLFSIQFIFQLVFEVLFGDDFFPSCQESISSGGSGGVECHSYPPPWDERSSSGKDGHDLIRVPLKGELSVFRSAGGGEQ